YSFVHDYFTERAQPRFEEFLPPLKGRPCRLLEIGTLEGRATIWLHDNIATHPDAHIDTVDPWDWATRELNFSFLNSDKLTYFPGYSIDFFRTLSVNSYDFVYVDGCHVTPYVLEDAVNAFRLLKTGGMIAFDDYDWEPPAPFNELSKPR